MDIAQTLGWTATLLFSVMVFPQIAKTIKAKDTAGVSLTLFLVYLIANIIALIYAYLISEPPLILKYIIAIVTTEIYIGIFLFYYVKKKRAHGI
jgi:uncharacterized protein with PQ loop repeat